MNWLDFVILGALAAGALYGLKLGLIKAVFMAVGLYVGWLLAAHLSDDLGELAGGLVGGSTKVQSILTSAAYGLIISAAVVAAGLASNLKFLLTMATLGLSGLVDRLGGLALGLVIGAALSSAVVIGLARLTYAFDNEVQAYEDVKVVQKGIESAMIESRLTPIYLDVFERLPANALGYIPADFEVAVDTLRDRQDEFRRNRVP